MNTKVSISESNGSIVEPAIIVNVNASARSNGAGIVILSFSQALDESDATNVNNYQFGSDVTVNTASLSEDKKQVTLSLTLLSDTASYQLTLGDIHTQATTENMSLGVVLDTLPPEQLYNDDRTEIVYEDDSWPAEWSYDNDRSSCYQGDAHETTGDGAWATMDFIGTGISYYSEIGADQGHAEIFIDDISQGVFDTYSDTYEDSKIICTASGLDFGVHTFKIVKVDGTWVRLDALKVYNSGDIEVASITNGAGKTFTLKFNQSLDKTSAENISNYSIDNNGTIVSASLSGNNNDTVTLVVDNVNKDIIYKLTINPLSNQIKTTTSTVTTTLSLLTDEALLDLVQKTTFNYYWLYNNASSGMAYERVPADPDSSGSGSVTTGGSGFGVMSIIVAIERGFISRCDGLSRIQTIVDFLSNKATRYKGAWAHWIDGDTGATIPFDSDQTGADIVETSFMIMGLFCARQYFNDQTLTANINSLWESIEWDYFTNNSDTLYWNIDEDLNVLDTAITGWNEAMITYILAISSPTHPISPDLWVSGWSQGSYSNKDQVYYGISVPVGPSYTGPIFTGQYSFQGFDPNQYFDAVNNVDYLEQVQAQAQVHHQHGVINPFGFTGYGDNCWGLTAGDGPDPEGYTSHQPTDDNGTITPTGALGAFPWLPEKSMKALRHFYDDLGMDIWTDKCGFIDGFNQTSNWLATEYLAIDQAPIINMIENYRSRLLWDLFMSCPEIQNGLNLIGFTQK